MKMVEVSGLHLDQTFINEMEIEFILALKAKPEVKVKY